MTWAIRGWKNGKVFESPDGQKFTDFGDALRHEIEKKEGKK